MKKSLISLSIFLFSILSQHAVFACTDIQVTAADGSRIIARSMEFAMPLNSELVAMPRGSAFNTKTPDGKPGMSWKSKNGYILIDGLNQIFTVDGMNEYGLSFEYLYLPGFTQYQDVPAGKESQAIPYYYFGDWILGNFKTVDEVRQALENVYVYQQSLPMANKMVFPLHAAIHDASGKGIVVEFIKGKMNVHEYMGVMTNSPGYEWHVTQLPEYLNLSPYSPKPVVVDGVAYSANGQGAGMLGLPGDISPSSRFIKMSYLLQYAYQASNAADAVNLAQHIMNNVDIPLGIARAKSNGQETADLTQWTVFKDLSNKILYYHTYKDLSLRSIDLKQIDFSENSPQLIMPMSNEVNVVSMTEQLKASKKLPVKSSS